MADARLHALQTDVLVAHTDEERRLHALQTDILVAHTDETHLLHTLQVDVVILWARSWGDIPDAKKVWHQVTSAATAKTVYLRKAFTIGPGYISGGTFTWQADHTCEAHLNGWPLDTFVASGSAVEPTTVSVPRNKLRGGPNLLAFKLVSEAGLRGMLEFKLNVFGREEDA